MKRVTCAILIGGLLVARGFAQSSGHCTLEQQKTFPEGYQDRSDRCEGLYKLKVSGTPLSFVGFSQPLGKLQWDKTPKLDLAWEAPPGKPVRLQAVSLQQTISYRMDSVSSGGNLQWPTQILGRVGLASHEVALAAWYAQGNGDVPRVYVPVLVGGPAASSALEIILFPGVDLNDCAVLLQAEGNAANLLEKNQPAAKKYPAAGAIRISVPPNLKPGLYKFEAFAHMSAGGTANAVANLRVP